VREARCEVPVTRVPFGLGIALAISVVATIYLGVLPNRVLQIAQHSAQDLLPQAPVPASNAAETPRPTAIPAQ
jgi:NADH:ubiquinone oxidoreductase subunit 4 (subunit M)